MRLAVVVPRYAQQLAGGAEALGSGLARTAARQGWQVEVWTTCARDHYTWNNEFPAGAEQHEGLLVRRFPVAVRRLAEQVALEARLAVGGKLTVAEQYAWLEGGPHSPALYAHIAAHAAAFDAVVVLPYATPLMHMAAWAAPERVLMWPCLHDEPYAYLEPLRLLLESVWGVAFNAPEEQALAAQRLRVRMRHQAVLGVGVPQDSPAPAVPPSRTELLAISRLEGGKNLALLYDHVRRYADEGGQLRLVVVGRGPLEPPDHPAFDYRGFVSEAERNALCASALAYCQPSLNESFSLTMMETWLAGRPVLVHRDCAVTRGHARRSRGGLWFGSYEEFVGAVEWLQQHPAAATRMGQNGGEYVRRNYSWQAVLERLERALTTWGRERQGAAAMAVAGRSGGAGA